MSPLAKKIAARYRGLFASDDDPKDSEDEKSGEWNLLISKYSPTRWRYTLKNPKGGSGGSTAYSTPKAAIAAAIGRGVNDTMGKDRVWVIEQVWNADAGTDGDYETKKTYWLDLKKGESSKKAAGKTLQCDMEKGCKEPVTHIDNRGFVYCTKHGERRKSDTPCRKLRPGEVKKLEDGGTIRYAYTYDRTASKEFWKPVMDETPKKVGVTWVRPGNQRDGEAHAFQEATFEDGSTVVNNESLCGKKFQGMAISKARAHGNTSSAQCPDCKKKA